MPTSNIHDHQHPLPKVNVQGELVAPLAVPAPDADPLSMSREMMQTVLDSVPAQIAYYNAHTIQCVFSNEAYAHANRTTASLAIGKHCRDIVGEAAWNAIEPHVARVLQGQAMGYERMVSTDPANPRWIEVNLRPHLNEHQVTSGVFVLIHDITQRHKSANAVRDSEEWLRKFTMATSEGIAFHRNGVIEDCNDALAQMLGIERAAVNGRRLLEFLPVELHEQALHNIQSHSDQTYHTHLVLPKGNLPVEIAARQFSFQDQQLRLVAVRDMTEQHNMRRKLSVALKQREAILASTAVGVVIIKGEHHEWSNDTLCRQLGRTSKELIGHSVAMHYAKPEQYRQVGRTIKRQIKRSQRSSVEAQMQRADGVAIWLQLDGCVLEEVDGEARTVWTTVDITQRKVAEIELRQTLEAERELGLLKTRFVSMASHEFRTPLATIQTSTDLLQHYWERLAVEERSGILQDIERSVGRMRVLMEDFLAFGRMGNGDVPCRLAQTGITGLIRQICSDVGSLDPDQDRIVLELDAELLQQPELMLDGALVRHIVGNLLTNAEKYSVAPAPVRISACHEGSRLRVDVVDQGIGIPAADMPRLFETFHRASNVSNIQGTGLGLAILKRALDAHKGQIDVSSEVGHGTCFTVWLPWVAAPVV